MPTTPMKKGNPIIFLFQVLINMQNIGKRTIKRPEISPTDNSLSKVSRQTYLFLTDNSFPTFSSVTDFPVWHFWTLSQQDSWIISLTTTMKTCFRFFGWNYFAWICFICFGLQKLPCIQVQTTETSFHGLSKEMMF